MWNIFKEEIEKYLLANNVDIHYKYYKSTEDYKRIENERLMGCHGFGAMSLGEFIERFLLAKEGVYDSIYDMGNTQKLTDDQCEDVSVAREIVAMRSSTVDEKDINVEVQEIVKIFYRKGGLIERLKKHLGIDLNAFDKTCECYKRERCKILYFFYMLEHEQFVECNVLELFSKPSMENIDNAVLSMETRNGKIIRAIRNELEKELPMQSKEMIKGSVREISEQWDSILTNAYRLMDFMYEKGCEYDFESVIHCLEQAVPISRISETLYHDIDTPMEVLYLKIVQHEYLGNVKDIAVINSIQKDYEYIVPPDLVAEMKQLHYSVIDINCVEQYIEDNAKKISKYVYLGEKTNKDDINRIRAAKKKVNKWLNFCIRAKPLLDLKLISNELQIISFLQAVILDDANEIFEYTFYRYEKYSKHMKRVQAALKNDEYVPHALQCYWVRKVADRWYANTGRYEERLKLRELEKVCDRILEDIFSEPDLFRMRGKHMFYLDRVDDDMITMPTQVDWFGGSRSI